METKDQEKITLSTFIEKNQAVINVFGVFAAVTAYFGQIKGNDFCNLLYLIFLVITVILGFELLEKFFAIPEDKISLKGKSFMNMFFIGVAIISTYVYFEFSKIIHSVAVFIVWEILVVFAIWILDKTGFLKNLYRGKEWKRIFKIITLIVIVALLFQVSEFIILLLSAVPFFHFIK